MKTRVLAVLLAVCMIAGTCVLSASAATFKAGSYVEKINAGGTLLADNIKAISSGTGFNIGVTATAKTGAELNVGTEAIDASNVDNLVTFKRGNTTITFKNDLAPYYDVSGTVDSNSKTATVVFSAKPANAMDVYRVVTDIDTTTDTDVTAKLDKVSPADKYNLATETVTVSGIKFVAKLCSVTMGVRFFGDTYNNLVASEIAKVDATVTRNGNGQLKQNITSSVTNVIKDLMPGDMVHLVASLKDPEKEQDYYGFYCWVDGSGSVLSTDKEIDYKVDGKDVAFYATFVELKNRYTIDYKSNGNGKVVYTEGREVFSGDAQISVLEGRDATFTFVPDEGYEVAKVLIDGKTDIASFKTVALAKLLTGKLAALKTLINATNKDVYSYTFPKVMGDHTIEVTFMPIENFEVPSGKELPTIEAEGITLATGANGEGGEGGEGGGANGANGGTTVPAEGGAAGNGGSAVGGVVNPATGSTGAIAVFAALSVAAAAAFVTAKKKED